MNILGPEDVVAIGKAILNSSAAATFDLVKYAEAQKKSYAENMDSVATLARNGAIGPATAKAAVEAFTDSQTKILLAIKEMKKTEAKIAINAGLSAIAAIVNRAAGFGILPV